MAKGICPTCAAVEAVLLASRRVPASAARKIAYNQATRSADKAVRRTKAVRKASDYSRKLSKHLKKERAKAMKKNGQFKKGMDMAKVMARAHKCVKKEMK